MEQKREAAHRCTDEAAKDLNHLQDSTSSLPCQVMRLCYRVNAETEHYACLQYSGSSTMVHVYEGGYRPQKSAKFLPTAFVGAGYQDDLRAVLKALEGYLEVGHAR